MEITRKGYSIISNFIFEKIVYSAHVNTLISFIFFLPPFSSDVISVRALN